MKLLPAKELNSKLQTQKEQEINAGLFIAKKVDRLREELADAQKLHDDSIVNMKREYESFISEQFAKREAIKKEIEILEIRHAELLIPLDAEWHKVREESDRNLKLSAKLNEREDTLSLMDIQLVRKADELDKWEKSIKDKEQTTEQLSQRAKEDYQEAQDILIEAKENEKQITQSLEIRSEAVSKRETDVAYREIDVENRNKYAIAKEKENALETKHIESKQRQLSSAFAELKKRNGTIHNTDQ